MRFELVYGETSLESHALGLRRLEFFDARYNPIDDIV